MILLCHNFTRTLYAQTFAGTYPCRDHGLACRKASAACRAGEKKAKDIHKVQSSYQSQPAPNESSLCLVLIRGNFCLKAAAHLHLVLGMFSRAGTAKQVPLCSLAAGSGPNPVPCFPNTTLGVIQLNSGCQCCRGTQEPSGATPSLAKASAKPGCSALGLQPWAT